jgi:hypothetical protein
MYIAKLKDGPKRVEKIFSMILERGFEMVWWRGKMESLQNEFLKLKCFSPLKILTSPFIWRDYWSFSFFQFSFFLFFSCSISWGLGGFDDIWGENHVFKNFISNGFNILAVGAYSGMELCMPTWLNHDYGDGGVVDILVVDAYSGVEVCMTIFLGEASN